MSTILTNLPPEKVPSSSDQTVQIFNNYYSTPVSINNNELIAMTGFLQSKGFDSASSENTAITILVQAAKEGYSAMEIMDSLKGLNNIAISGVVAEILNFNRLKTSQVGVKQTVVPSQLIHRNIVA